jgi:hypothetical protein
MRDAKPLPMTSDEPLTFISIGPRKGAFFIFFTFTPGTIPKLASRVFALYPALTLNTITSSPLAHSVRYIVSRVPIF